MKTKTMVLSIIVSIVFFVNSISYSQELETVGAGVIKFLLTNPKTASQTNATETAALRVIGNLLSISAHRKHQMNVANAVRSEIVINTTGGRQATMYSDNEGNIYLLFNEKIYPISSGLVNQAKEETAKIKGSSLPAYNLSMMRSEYKFEKTISKRVVDKKKHPVTLNELAQEYNVSIDNIYLNSIAFKSSGYTIGNKAPPSPEDKSSAEYKIYEDFFKHGKKLYPSRGKTVPNYHTEKVWRGMCCLIMVLLKWEYYDHKIVTTFTCNWAKDFDGKGLDFDDFQGVKRSFYKNEKLLFVLGYTSETVGTWSLEIYEASTGNVVYKKNGTTDKDKQVITVEKDGEKLKPGVYMYNFTLMTDGKDNILKSEKFEIIRSEGK